MTPERAAQVAHEADYWRAILDDVKAVNALTVELADDLANTTVALVSLISLTDARANEFVRDGMGSASAGMRHVSELGTALDRMLRIIDGRHLALRQKVDA